MLRQNDRKFPKYPFFTNTHTQTQSCFNKCCDHQHWKVTGNRKHQSQSTRWFKKISGIISTCQAFPGASGGTIKILTDFCQQQFPPIFWFFFFDNEIWGCPQWQIDLVQRFWNIHVDICHRKFDASQVSGTTMTAVFRLFIWTPFLLLRISS